MADDKSRFQRAIDFLNAPTKRQEQKYSRYNQQTSLDRAVYGYNSEAGYWPVSQLDDIGDGSNNSAVVACLNVLATSFAEPRAMVVKEQNGQLDDIVEHPLVKILERPNPFTSGNLLAHYIVVSLSAYGDAFLYKNRNSDGTVVQLIPLMPNLVEPKGDEDTLITHFKYSPHGGLGGNSIVVPTNDIVHIRQGIDPNNHRRGFAPLKSVLREILGDEAAGQYAAALLNNMAVPGVILSPKDDSMGGPSKEEAEAIAAMYKQKFGGKNRGAPMILSGAMNVEVVSFSPDQMKLSELRKLPEERVSAVLGVPAILAGLGAGLDAATYNNTRELREFFTEQKLVPLWKSVAQELTHQLLRRDYQAEDLKIKYNLDDVRALSQDRDDLYKRMNTAVQGGWITIGEARKEVGLEADETHDVYLRPMNMIETAPGQSNAPKPEQEDPKPEQDDPVLQIAKQLIDKVLTTGSGLADPTRSDVLKPTPTYLNEEKYVAEMPNGAWCILDHDDNQVIECYESEDQARSALDRMKKDEKDIKQTNFPSRGDDQTISISNSKFKQFPDYNYVKNLKEDWPEIWRRAGTGGNPPTSFTGNDAFNRWTKYRSGDRSESVLNWVKRRESFMARHSGNTKLNGYIAVMKWGGVTKTGVSAMKKTVNEYKKVIRERRKIQEALLLEIEEKALSAATRESLRKKVEQHNSKNPKHRATLRMLTACYNRGLAAYQNNPGSVRGNVSSPQQWAMARVNGLLRALRTGKFKRKPYDTDLLPSSHPLSSKKNANLIIEEINVSTEEAEALAEVEMDSARSEKAPAGSIKKGDAVSWRINKDPDPPSTANGIVTSVKTSGSISAGQESLDATPEKPVAKIQVWAINEDGSRTKTDRSVIQPVSKLRKISDFR